MVKILVSNGAEVNIPTPAGETLLKLAEETITHNIVAPRKKKIAEIIKILQSAPMKISEEELANYKIASTDLVVTLHSLANE